MTLLPPRISDALWRIVPAPLQRRLRSTVVKRFIRFAPAAFCAVAATQITYIICLGPANLTAGVAGFAGWFAGAAVSYVISRWAWERKGRPHLLKETLPFVAVSIGAGIILTLASKFGNHVAMEMNLDGAARVIVADLFYFAANCLTFALRFLIFHFVLFADRNAKVDTLEVVEGRAPVTDEPVKPLLTTDRLQADEARFADTMGSLRVNGHSAWAKDSAESHAPTQHDEADGTIAPEHGSRR
jgi:putative flippase GtrA